MQETPYKTHWTITEIAEKHHVTGEAIRLRILAGKLPAEKIGRQWVVRDSDLKAFEAQKENGETK